ncbi:inactive protein RESTRICTED TEV MOVEMENT 2-like [Solanum lycopersicum]|uniref:SHSP domain-containing protein n=1 Tax=Solanum lycopersicum TaxID=4081 RepID=A0A3Q7E9A5_SOLLC|nr:inactive protein RESTRICTED TEV MOVEMENT 2-like [Solanum lycopersicum]
MNSKGATPTQVYEDFVPSSKKVHEENFDTIHINLHGFKKEQLKVVLTSTGTLKISGQRPIGPTKWQRFLNEFPVAENCDRSKISAKFENGILHVKQPKLIPKVEKEKELSATLAENTPAAKRQKTTLRDEFGKQDNADVDTPAKEEPKETSPKTSEQTEEKKLPSHDSSSSSSSHSSESDSESTDDDTDDEASENVSCLVANLKKPSKVIQMTLVSLLVLGISLYIANERSH